MKYFWILVAVMAVGCGDESNFGRPSTPRPETESVTLGSIVMERFFPADEFAVLEFTIDGHGFERSEVYEVGIYCEGDCIMLGEISLWDDGIRTMSGYYNNFWDIPMDAMRGDQQMIFFRAQGNADDLKLSVVADIIK